MKKIVFAIIILFVAGGFIYLSANDKNESSINESLFQNWELTSNKINGSEKVLPEEVRIPNIEFTKDNRVSGNASCNKFNGTYEADGSKITLSEMASTLMFCDEATMKVEAEFLATLPKMTTYVVENDILILSDATKTNVLIFDILEEASLEKTTWNVMSVNNGNQAVISVIENSNLTMLFELGRVTGSSGCNNYSGAYKLTNPNIIDINSIATTAKGCAENIMNQENQFIKALENSTVYTISDGTLELRNETGALQVSAIASESE